jgi:hypothetical protein
MSVLRDLNALGCNAFEQLSNTAPETVETLGEVKVPVPSWGKFIGRWMAARIEDGKIQPALCIRTFY